jgi:PrcB C-terminal
MMPMLIVLALAQAVVPFTTVAQGAMSNIEEPRQAVVRTAAEWQALWKQHAADFGTPPVDFTQSMVAAVFLGSRSTAGFTAEITAVKTEGARTVVEYRERQPARDEFVAQVLTSPFHIVRIARTAGSIEFRRLTK